MLSTPHQPGIRHRYAPSHTASPRSTRAIGPWRSARLALGSRHGMPSRPRRPAARVPTDEGVPHPCARHEGSPGWGTRRVAVGEGPAGGRVDGDPRGHRRRDAPRRRAAPPERARNFRGGVPPAHAGRADRPEVRRARRTSASTSSRPSAHHVGSDDRKRGCPLVRAGAVPAARRDHLSQRIRCFRAIEVVRDPFRRAVAVAPRRGGVRSAGIPARRGGGLVRRHGHVAGAGRPVQAGLTAAQLGCRHD